MITAVNEWALTKNNPPRRHPLPSIRKALEEKASGRVFQTDQTSLVKKASSAPGGLGTNFSPAPKWMNSILTTSSRIPHCNP